MKINGSNYTIMVSNMSEAVSFYESIGLTLKQRWDDHYAMLTAPDITIGLHPSEDGNTNSGTTSVGFMIDDIAEAAALLDKNNIKHDEQIDGGSGTYVYFKDPFGTVLYFVKPKWS